MMRAILLASAALLGACAVASSAVDPPGAQAARPARAAEPTTRLVLPGVRPPADVDCDAFPDQRAAQRTLRLDPRDPHHLDADRDGIACEHLDRAR